jgi:hypothetical protein
MVAIVRDGRLSFSPDHSTKFYAADTPTPERAKQGSLTKIKQGSLTKIMYP